MEKINRFGRLQQLISNLQMLESELDRLFEEWPEGGERVLALDDVAQYLPSQVLRRKIFSLEDSGAQWAFELIETTYNSISMPREAASFAKICIELFPTWFEFKPYTFSVHTWEHGLKLIVSGSMKRTAVFFTSNARGIYCVVYGEVKVDTTVVHLHYAPTTEQVNNARAMFELALHYLFPERGLAPVSAKITIPDGEVFP